MQLTLNKKKRKKKKQSTERPLSGKHAPNETTFFTKQTNKKTRKTYEVIAPQADVERAVGHVGVAHERAAGGVVRALRRGRQRNTGRGRQLL